ncbi:HPF/RaiA family ribosome-associated protein [Pseudomonas sp. Marseille-QA0892]
MQILVNSNHSVSIPADHEDRIRATVESEVARFEDHLTRIEVHLTDENGGKSGAQDKRCQIEARVKSHEPVSVTHKADSFDLAVEGAATKLNHALDHTMGKLRRI